MATGTIKRLVVERGFGFITAEDGTRDIFFHATRVRGVAPFTDLEEGDTVAYDDDVAEDGRARAVNVEVIGRSVAALPSWPPSGPRETAGGNDQNVYDCGEAS